MPTASCFATAERHRARKNRLGACASERLSHFLFFGAAARIRTHAPLVRGSVGARKWLIRMDPFFNTLRINATERPCLYRAVLPKSPGALQRTGVERSCWNRAQIEGPSTILSRPSRCRGVQPRTGHSPRSGVDACIRTRSRHRLRRIERSKSVLDGTAESRRGGRVPTGAQSEEGCRGAPGRTRGKARSLSPCLKPTFCRP
jgi:hypothetical protein